MSKAVLKRNILASVVVGGLALLLAGPATAAPVLSNTAAVKSAAANVTTDVRWRRWGWRRGYYFIGSSYGGWRRGYCHIPGGYYRPNACW